MRLWLGLAFTCALSMTAPAQPAEPVQCTSPAGGYSCPAGTECDTDVLGCLRTPATETGDMACPDEKTVCPAPRECRMVPEVFDQLQGDLDDADEEDSQLFECIMPDAEFCTNEHTGSRWCQGYSYCNKETGRCEADSGMALCPDQRTGCDKADACQKDDAGLWSCAEADAQPAFPPTPGAVARIAGTWTEVCGWQDPKPTFHGDFVIDITKAPTNITGQMTGDHGTRPLTGVYGVESVDGNIGFRVSDGSVLSMDFFGRATPDGAGFTAEGKINGSFEQHTCRGTWSGKSP
jgi:hypothetical protein